MWILYLLPKNILSRWMGCLAGVRLPRGFRKPFLGAFGRFFGVNFDEIAQPLESFACLQDFFIRELKPDLRPIAKSRLISPCDGAFGQSGTLEKDTLFQIKGKPYSLAKLIGEPSDVWEKAFYSTIYLSPKDYHRFHMPCDAEIKKVRYIPGQLWPVNSWAVSNIDELFCVNERMVCWLGEDLILVAVGATMVGRVKLRFDATLATNLPNSPVVTQEYPRDTHVLRKGEELGHFEFGSTLVLISRTALRCGSIGNSVRIGQSLSN